MDNFEPTPPTPESDDNDSGFEAIGFDQVLEILEKGEFEKEHGSIQWSSNYTFLTSVSYDHKSVTGVYKPQRGERPLWDFPDGTLCYRERASFLVSEALGWKIVPPTVLREGPRGLGSLQFYVDHDPDYHYFSFDESLTAQLMRLSLFDVLVNNADRKGGHCIVDSQGHLWGIDHGITFHAANKLRTVIWNFAGNPIPQILMDDVEALCARLDHPEDDIICELQKLLNAREMNSFTRRVRFLLNEPLYPTPGPGPNYPWPPV
jgi:hypothetical protein